MHVGEAVVAALEFAGEAFVIDAEEVQHRGLEIVDADFVFDGVEAFPSSPRGGEGKASTPSKLRLRNPRNPGGL